MTDLPGVPLEKLQRGTIRLLELAQSTFPMEVPHGQNFHLLRKSAGLFARIVGAAETALLVSQRDRRADLAVVIRSVFEHLVMLAWITGDRPSSYERMALWQLEDDVKTLKYDDEIAKLADGPVLVAETRALMERDIAAMGTRRLPDLATRCQVADREWAGIAGFGDPSAPDLYLRSVYSSLYRSLSGAVHPTGLGLEFVSTRTEERTIIDLEAPGEGAPTFGVTPGLLNVAMVITMHVIGRPTSEKLESAIDAAMADFHRPAN